MESEKRGTALVWRRRAGAGGMVSKSAGLMTHEQALALQTLKRFSSRQIPSLVSESLSSLFETAENRLRLSHSDSERRYRKWVDKVEVESGAFALQHPAIDSNTFSTVSRALFSSRNSKWSIASAPKRIRKPRRLSTPGLGRGRWGDLSRRGHGRLSQACHVPA